MSGSNKKQPFQRHWTQRASYAVLRRVLQMTGITGLGVRCFGRENIPEVGGALICANHQSNLDPPLLGSVINRRLNYLAKKQLFNKQPLRWLIRHLDAIPIDRDGMGIGGIKEMPGFCALAKRTKVPMVPIGFDGAFQSWPRGTTLPSSSRIWIVIGKPITPEDYDALDNESLIKLLGERIEACFEEARSRRKFAER